jgi:hypothetical protein
MNPQSSMYPALSNRTTNYDSIIAVHGLNGDAFRTWTNEAGRCWLRDLLPNNLTSARILSFGYDARVFKLFGKTSADGVLSHAQSLVAELASNRKVNIQHLPLELYY